MNKRTHLRHEKIRDAAHHFTALIASFVKSPRERDIAFDKVQEAVFWAIKGVVPDDTDTDDGESAN